MSLTYPPTDGAARPGRLRGLVTGSRTWTAHGPILAALLILKRSGRPVTVLHGACPTGADAITDAWCAWLGIPVERYPAPWATHGRAAGPRRNAAMVATRPDLCLAFIHHGSPGATGCADLAHAAGIPTIRHPHPEPANASALPVPAVPRQRRHAVDSLSTPPTPPRAREGR